MKKKVKRKFNFIRFIIFILILCIIYFMVHLLLNIKTKNIVILNNNYYSDEVIIETANIENYPEFILLRKSEIKNKLKKLDIIDDVKVSKSFDFILTLDIKENKILYLTRSTNQYKLSSGKSISDSNKYSVPTLINYVPQDIETSFVEEFSKIDSSIISLVSEIEYSKTEFDSKRFKFYMNDGNLVYINTNKMENFNKYLNIVTKLENKKGILYLDSGNYFEIRE